MSTFVIVAVTILSMATAEEMSTRNITQSFRVGKEVVISLSEISDPYWIQPYGPGVVNGYKSCGGSGDLYVMRFETCSGDHDTWCQVPGDDQMRRAELHFMASQDISSLAVRVYATAKGIPLTLIFEKSLTSVTIWRSYKYSLNAELSASALFKGMKVSLQFDLVAVHHDREVKEICGLAEFEIV